MLFRETIAAYYVNNMKLTIALYEQKGRLCMLKLVARIATVSKG
jgi:hypothetical protein